MPVSFAASVTLFFEYLGEGEAARETDHLPVSGQTGNEGASRRGVLPVARVTSGTSRSQAWIRHGDEASEAQQRCSPSYFRFSLDIVSRKIS